MPPNATDATNGSPRKLFASREDNGDIATPYVYCVLNTRIRFEAEIVCARQTEKCLQEARNASLSRQLQPAGNSLRNAFDLLEADQLPAFRVRQQFPCQ